MNWWQTALLVWAAASVFMAYSWHRLKQAEQLTDDLINEHIRKIQEARARKQQTGLEVIAHEKARWN